ncbi:MAG TPA: DUF222 domain-containing protein [Jiangellaceae bacterium]
MNERAVAQRLIDMVGEMAGLPSQVGDDPGRIDVIAGLERLKAAAAAAQLAVVADFAGSQEAANRALGVEARAARRGVPEQVGLARKVAPATAARQVSQARALRDELPATYELLCRGEISEWVATIVVTETSHLAAEDRRLVDKKLAADLAGLSPRRAQARAKALGYEVDPEGAVRRAGNARKDRRVSMRPAPDTMAMLSALLPCEQGVAAWAALRRHADALVAAGDGRTRNQIMADSLVERLTGKASAEAVDAEIGLVMTDSALFDGDDEPADLEDYGPIPAETARDIARRAGDQAGAAGAYQQSGSGAEPDSGGDSTVRDRDHTERARTASSDDINNRDDGDSSDGDSSAGDHGGAGDSSEAVAELAQPGAGVGADSVERDPGRRCGPAFGWHQTSCGCTSTEQQTAGSAARMWVRRLFTDPAAGVVTDCDPRRRRFTGVLARMLVYRDQRCRNVFCDAPIRHLDHIESYAGGGPTTPINGQGLCARCNYVRQMPGWTSRVIDPRRHIVEITTPTGHTYRSPAPAAPGTSRQRAPT